MKINFNKRVLIALFVVFTIIFGFLLWREQKIVVVTDGIKYDNEGTLRVKIKNLFLKKICFSSCYPYYLEKKDGVWRPYSYQDCQGPNLVEKCIGPGRVKAFEISLPLIKKGVHRIVVPICEDCRAGEEFQESKRFYSNEFEIE